MATVVRDWISKAAKSNHRIGRLDAVGQQRWKKQQGPLSGIRVWDDRRDLDCSEFICLVCVRPRDRRIVELVTRRGELEDELKPNRPLSDTGADLVKQIVVRSVHSVIFRQELFARFRNYLIPPERGFAVAGDEFEGIDAELGDGPVTHRSQPWGGRKRFRLGMGFEIFLDRRGGRDPGTAGCYSQDKLPHVLRVLCRESV